MVTTTDYGSWNTSGDKGRDTVESTVEGFISGGDSEWRERLEATGTFKRMVSAYRDAINEALPDGVTLSGNDFYGPYDKRNEPFDGYPAHEDGGLDIKAIVDEIDLGKIVEKHDLPEITVADIRKLLESPAEDPVLYVKVDDEDGTLSIDVWASALVPHNLVITHQARLLEDTGHNATDDLLLEEVKALQEDVDRIAGELKRS